MASTSENLASIEPWFFKPTFSDSWVHSETYEEALITKPLHKSLYSTNPNPHHHDHQHFISHSISPFLHYNMPDTLTTTSTVSAISAGSNPEIIAPKRQRKNAIPATGAKKRKSRASNRSQTTFITADVASFKQMVQQVTGVGFGRSLVSGIRSLGSSDTESARGTLPTLDTLTAFMLDRQQQLQLVMGPSSTGTGPQGLGAAVGLDFDSSSCFPTLDS